MLKFNPYQYKEEGPFQGIGSSGFTLTKEIPDFTEEWMEPEEPFCPSAPVACEDSAMWQHLGSRVLPSDAKSAHALVLGFSASTKVRNKSLLLINHPVFGILLEQPEWTRINTRVIKDSGENNAS